MATETDAGIGLNARQRFQAEENAAGNGGNGIRYGITYQGLAVNLGNINGVIDSMPGLYMRTRSVVMGLEGHNFPSLALGSGWTAYSSGGVGATNGVEVIYSANGLTLHAHSTDTATAFGASYSMGNITVAAGQEQHDDDSKHTLVTALFNVGSGYVDVAHGITTSAAGVDTDKTVIKGGYDVAPGANVYGFVSSADAGEGYGIGVSYDLGGGASFEGAASSGADKRSYLSAGLIFSF